MSETCARGSDTKCHGEIRNKSAERGASMFKQLPLFLLFLQSILNTALSAVYYNLKENRKLQVRGIILSLISLLLVPAYTVAQQVTSANKSTKVQQERSVNKTKSSVKSTPVKSPDEYLSRATEFGFSGAVLIAKDNKIILNKGYGLADRESGRPITAETVFDIGSITKQFTAAAIMRLEEQGKVSVNDALTKYFENIPEDKRAITIHHLLTHSSGMPLYSGDDYELINRDTFVERAMSAPLRFKPGERQAYSNPGYSILAVIIEKVSGQSYETFVREQILRPAGMEGTGYTAPFWKTETLARGYSGLKDERTPLDFAWWGDGPSWNLRANGGFLSTLGDLYRWHLALEGNKVLSESSKRKMASPHVATQNPDRFAGYGWFVSQTPRKTRLVSHSGGNGIFAVNFRRYVDEGVVMLFATNDSQNDWALEAQAEALLFGKEIPLPPKKQADITPAALKRYAGTYSLPSGSTFTVSLTDGQLTIDPQQNEIGRLLSKFPEIKEANRLNKIETLVSQVISAFAGKNFEPLKEILRKETPFAEEKEYWEGAFDKWQQQHGKFQSVEVIGSQKRDTSIDTYVLIRFERGTRLIRFEQNPEGKFFIQAGPPQILPDLYRLVPLSANEFTTYNLRLSSGASIHFQAAEDRVSGLTIKGESGDTQAKRVN